MLVRALSAGTRAFSSSFLALKPPSAASILSGSDECAKQPMERDAPGMTRGTLQPYEILLQDRQSADEAGVPSMLARRPADEPRRQIVVSLTPWTAFAAAALVVSVLAFTYTLGRRQPLASREPKRTASDSLEDVRRQEPISYEQLQVDRGR